MADRIKVTARLDTPFIKVGYMTLDGLLAALLFDQIHDIDRAHREVPLAHTDGLYHASAAIFEPIASDRTTFIASLHPSHSIDPDLILKNKRGALHRKFDSSLTNVLNTYPSFSAPEIIWYAEGDATRIQEMLREARFIGKRRASGFGEVLNWSLESDELDGIVGPFGEPLRPVPIDMFPGDKTHPIIDAAWKPAYWDVMNRTACYAPQDW